MATKSERLNLRLTTAQDVVLRRAAEANGESMSEYVLRHAIEAAETDLADRRVFVLDDDAWDRLQATLDRPAARKPQLAELLVKPSVLERR
jgi:uncharacterized protein (DUF1778 family)